MTQPTLSRQLMDLEEEIGKKLLIRGNRRITLTEEGLLLRKRATEILDLVEKTEAELTAPDEVVSGDVYIGGGETDAMRLIAQIAKDLQKTFPLASRSAIRPEDLLDLPIITSRQTMVGNAISGRLGKDFENMNIVATYNLVYNAALMAEEGLGYVLTLDKLVNTSENSRLCFRPLLPRMEAHLDIVWKKYQIFSGAADRFLSKVQEVFNR